jgi:hypothetical protein
VSGASADIHDLLFYAPRSRAPSEVIKLSAWTSLEKNEPDARAPGFMPVVANWLIRHNNIINHMDHTIRLEYIGDGD